MTVKSNIEFVDRYDGNYPNLKTVCKGYCEGMGIVPIQEDETDKVFKALWNEADKKKHADDGCHFVRCPECNGAGKK